MKLAPRRRKFAAEYVKNGFNGYQAILAAGYKMGYNAACVEASRLLRNPKVAQIVEEHLRKHKMTAEEVAEELSQVASAKTDVTEAGKLKALEMLTKVHGMITSKSEVTHQSTRSDQLNQAKQSYILAALPDLQLNHPNLPISDLEHLAEQRFQAWIDGLNLTPVITEQVQ